MFFFFWFFLSVGERRRQCQVCGSKVCCDIFGFDDVWDIFQVGLWGEEVLGGQRLVSFFRYIRIYVLGFLKNCQDLGRQREQSQLFFVLFIFWGDGVDGEWILLEGQLLFFEYLQRVRNSVECIFNLYNSFVRYMLLRFYIIDEEIERRGYIVRSGRFGVNERSFEESLGI